MQSVFRSVASLPTCLNYEKILALAAGLYLSAHSGAIVECGIFRGGTTLFMALLLKALGIRRKIYAFDTFDGLPAPTEKDIQAGGHYPEGFFSETSHEAVVQLFRQHGLGDDFAGIELVPGLVEKTLPLIFPGLKQGVSLAFLDMDQHSGIFHALAELLKHRMNGVLVFVDDAAIPGVDLAIREACAGRVAARSHLTQNLDLLVL